MCTCVSRRVYMNMSVYIYMYIWIYVNVCVYVSDFVYAPPWGLSTLAKEFSVAARILQSSSKELSTLVADTIYQPLRSGRIWHKVNF